MLSARPQSGHDTWPRTRIQAHSVHLLIRSSSSSSSSTGTTNTLTWSLVGAMAAPTTGLAAATTCPAYPWPQDGAAQRAQKVFMQSDCAACHSMLPYAGLREAAAAEVGPKAAEILVVGVAAEDARLPAAGSARPVVHGGGAYTPDLTALVAKVQEGLRYNLYSSGGAATVPAPLAAVCQELKKKMVWLQFVQPYVRTFQAA